MYRRDAKSAEVFLFSAIQKKKRDPLCSLRLCGERSLSCRPWPAPIDWAGSGRLSCYLVVDTGQEGAEKRLVQEILTVKEQREWQHFGRHERRQRQWLLGRWAVKKAVCALVGRENLEPMDVEIYTVGNGRPVVSWELRKEHGCNVSISIAHSEGDIVAIAGGFQDVGIDIEPVDRECERLEGLILNEGEQGLVSQVFPQSRREGILRFWCVKEAVAKAVGSGMVGGPLNLVVEKMDLGSGKMQVSLRGKIARQAPRFQNRLIQAFSGCADGLVYATSVVP